MNTVGFNRRRVLALLGAVGMPVFPAAAKEIPECPTQKGKTGVWEWSVDAKQIILRQIKKFSDDVSVRLTVSVSPHEENENAIIPTLILKNQEQLIRNMFIRVKFNDENVYESLGIEEEDFLGDDIFVFPGLRGLPRHAIEYLKTAEYIEIAFALHSKEKIDYEFDFETTGFNEAFNETAPIHDKFHELWKAKKCEYENCYFTSATCGSLGLPNDCWELTALRKFRDTYVSQLQSGASEIAAYYDLAPKLLETMAARSDFAGEMMRGYVFFILPCALLSRAGFNAACRWLYRNRMKHLLKRYGPDLASSLHVAA